MRKFFWLLTYHDNRCDFSFVMDFQSFTVLTVQNLSSVIPERIDATAIKIISRFSRFTQRKSTKFPRGGGGGEIMGT